MLPVTLFLDFCAVAAGLAVNGVVLGSLAFCAVCMIGSLKRKAD